MITKAIKINVYCGDSRYSRFPFSLEFESVVVALFRLPSRVRLVIISKKLIAIRRGLSGHRFCLRYSRTHLLNHLWVVGNRYLFARS